jgi:hypothetical protein
VRSLSLKQIKDVTKANALSRADKAAAAPRARIYIVYMYPAPGAQQEREREPRLQYAHTCMQRENCFLIINKVREELSAQDFLSSACFFETQTSSKGFALSAGSQHMPGKHRGRKEKGEAH